MAGRGQIKFVGYATAADTGGGTFNVALNSLSGGIASAAAAGDYVIVLLVHADNIDASIQCNTAGFDVIGSELLGNDTNKTNTELYAKRMTSTPDTSVELQTPSDAGESSVAIAHIYRGVDPTTPLDGVTVQTVETINTVLFDPPSITPTTPGAWIVIAGGGAHAEGTQTYANSSLSGVASVGSDGTDRDASGIMAYYSSWTSGSYNPPACTFTGSDSTTYSCAGYTLVLRPA